MGPEPEKMEIGPDRPIQPLDRRSHHDHNGPSPVSEHQEPNPDSDESTQPWHKPAGFDKGLVNPDGTAFQLIGNGRMEFQPISTITGRIYVKQAETTEDRPRGANPHGESL